MVSVERNQSPNDIFGELDLLRLKKEIDKKDPSAILIIPADNPTGYQMSQESVKEIAKICVDNDLWLISDEAYRNIYFSNNGPTSIWEISNDEVPGINERRITIESVSKVWNACGLRIGALVTDNRLMYEKVRSEYTANLCANVIGQYIFGAVAHLSRKDVIVWYRKQRLYYLEIINSLTKEIKKELPGLIFSMPGAAIYIVLDFKNITPDTFNISKFVEYCSLSGNVKIDGRFHTLLLSPMEGFYRDKSKGKKQARIALVEPESKMKIVPKILSRLLENYLKTEEL